MQNIDDLIAYKLQRMSEYIDSNKLSELLRYKEQDKITELENKLNELLATVKTFTTKPEIKY
jgi:hypothetical protein